MTREPSRLPFERVAVRGGHGRWYCTRPQPRGWHCARGLHLDGPCALLPRWWNLRARWRSR